MALKGRVRKLIAVLAKHYRHATGLLQSGLFSWTISMIPTMAGTLQLE